MYTFLIVVIVIAAFLLGLVVLMQNSKGGGLSSTFASSSQFMGVRKTADFLEKLTWGLAVGIVVLCFASSIFAGSGAKKAEGQQGSKAAGAQTSAPMPMQAPAADATAEMPAAEESQPTE